MKPIRTFAALLFAATALTAVADEIPVPRLEIVPTGRLFINAAGLISNNDEVRSGVAMPEACIGLKAGYGIWSARVEVGFDYGKVRMKDVSLTTRLTSEWSLKAGHFYQPFGLQSANSSVRASLLNARCSDAFDSPRSIGLMAKYDSPRWWGAMSVAAEPKATFMSANETGGQGWGIYGRFLYRPFTESGRFMHIGISGAFQTPQYNADEELNHKCFTFDADLPSFVSRIKGAEALVDHANSLVKFSPEFLAGYGRWAFETQYYDARVFRTDGFSDFRGYGVYAKIHAIILGGDYSYQAAEGMIQRPGPKTLSVVLNYNYLCLNSADISGGRMSDVSAALSWYITPWLTWRFRTGYTHSWACGFASPTDFTSFETSMQVMF